MNENYTSDHDRAAGTDGEPSDHESRIGGWTSEIEASRKRERDFRIQGKIVTKMYEGREKRSVPFNILYSNTETLLPACYNNTPRPVVKPRYKKNDPLPKAAATLAASFLEFFVDTGDGDATPFDTLVLRSLVEALVPGRGVTRFDYSSDVENGADGTPKRVRHEYVCGEHVSYDQFLHGYAKTWDKVPWVAFEHYLTKEEVKEHKDWSIPEEGLPYTSRQGADTDEEGTPIEGTEGQGLCHIYEIWDRTARKVLFFPDGGKAFLAEHPDEYKLTGFFPTPEPMGFVQKISGLAPVALYDFYENQAKELNILTERIKAVTRAIKAVGFYNPLIEGVEDMLKLEDGQLTALQGGAALGESNIGNAFWMWPVEKLITVLVELMQQREACKAVIYEIMGISDILRGSSVASETATAQRIKSQWGGLRVKKFQKEVARYVKDCLRIAAELGFSMLSPDTIYASTGTSLPRRPEYEAAQARVRQAQMAAQMAQLTPPPPGPTPPPPPPAPSPQDIALLAMPIFEDVVKALASDIRRKYLIDIELNSTVDAEATEDKTELTEFLTAMAQFFSAVGPLVENKTLPWQAAKAMMLTISRKFRMGRDLDDELSTMIQPAGGDAGAQEAMAKVQEAMAKLKDQQTAFEKQQLQGQMAAADTANKMKVQSLQAAMKNQSNQMQLAVQAMNEQVRDVKTKAMLDQLLTKIQTAAQLASTEAAVTSAELDHQIESKARDVEDVHQELEHGVEKAGLKLDLKAQQVKAAAKPAPAKAK